jgi:methyl-accepting chemotaxis protein
MGQALLVLVVMSLFTIVVTSMLSKRIMSDEVQALDREAQTLVASMQSYHAALAGSAEKLAAVFRSKFPSSIHVDTSKLVTSGAAQAPALVAGSTTINNDTSMTDDFTAVTGALATVFVRNGDDFIRVATSVKKEDGSRALGTPLDRNHPAYRRLVQGEGYSGKAVLFGKDYMSNYQPLKERDGTVIGALFVGVDFTDGLKAMKERFRSLKIGKTGYIFALDANEGKDLGVLTLHPTLEGKKLIDVPDHAGKKFIREIVEKKEGVTRYLWMDEKLGDTKPREKIVVYRYLKEWGWVIALACYFDEFNGTTTLVRDTIIVATVIVILALSSILALLVRRWITKPVRRLAERADLYAAGDFSAVPQGAAEVEKVKDEVKFVQGRIDAMAASLREIIAEAMHSANEVGGAAGEVSQASRELAAGTDEIAGKTHSVAGAGEEMAATSANIAQTCQRAAEGAELAKSSARNGDEVVQATVAIMNEIARKVQESARSVEGLGKRGGEIGEIVGAIEEIADQTNLLALNAAIEAARAGDQGRSFAVVADEVRALAERTAGATRQIAGMIASIQQETKQAVAVMEQGVAKVEAGTAEAARSGDALSEIIAGIESVATQLCEISSAAEQQTATTREIAATLNEITTVVQATAGQVHNSATAAEQLEGNARELQRLVGRFRVT